MLSSSNIIGSGFTVIVDDPSGEDRSQDSINEMFVELRSVLNSHGFDIGIVADQDDAMRLQGRLLIARMIDKLDKLCQDE